MSHYRDNKALSTVLYALGIFTLTIPFNPLLPAITSWKWSLIELLCMQIDKTKHLSPAPLHQPLLLGAI